MIDAEDLQVPGTNTLKNKFGIADPTALSHAVSDCTARRMTELQASPIRGGFDSSHLQAIHRYLFQYVFDWAGELRHIETGSLPATSIEESLNRSLDRLSRENLLRGLSAEEWTRRASGYVEDLRSLHPFLAGNDLAIAEFATELARKNNLTLQWEREPDAVSDAVAFAEQAERSALLRRLIMLAVDADPLAQISHRPHSLERGSERSPQISNSGI
jgi:cell filamentation protein